jgi:flagellar protein FlgJ
MDNIDNSIKFQGQFDMSRNANDIQGLDKLRRAAQSGDDAALQEAAKQFEAIFVQMMLKSMRKAQDVMADKDSPFNSEQVKFYRDMHDQQLATDMSNSGSIGLADIIVKQLSKGGNGFTPASVIRNDGNLSDINRHSAKSIQQAQQIALPEQRLPQTAASNAGYKDAAFSDQNEFLDALYPVAQQVAKELGIEPKALLAQAAVETGWGQYMMHTEKGNTHNLFGIKAGNGWQGDTVKVNTIEFEQGLAAPKKAEFRAYNSFDDAMQDYASFVKENPRYKQALQNTGDPKRYFDELQQAGYATDPTYAQKVISVLNSGTLNNYQP